MGRTPVYLLIALALSLSGAGCSSKPHVVVGSKNFTEQVILGEIVAQQIERRLNIPVEHKLDLGGTLIAHEALKNGGIDLYPEYTGTALTAVLKQPVVKDAKEAFEKVATGYKAWSIEWLPPFGFNNSFAMVVRSDLARERNLKTLSDAARSPQLWHFGVGYEFAQRPDGLTGLVQTYGLRLEGAPVTMDLGLLYPALESKKIDMAAANATDGMLAHPQFTVLEDDKHYFPPYECAIAVRSDTMARIPGLRDALTALSGRISNQTMRRMNELVDVEHKPVPDVARDFLNSLK
jgi:glycine betaine/choline ABC-type transport system substrate-binding protein